MGEAAIRLVAAGAGPRRGPEAVLICIKVQLSFR